MTELSAHFTVEEMSRSDLATRLGIDNTPIGDIKDNLRLLCWHVLEPIREHFGPVAVNSGYRCPELNAAAGGSKSSQHMFGRAADIECAGVDNYRLAKWISENIGYDQLILEFYKSGQPRSGWVHVSYLNEGRRHESLTTPDGKLYMKGLIK